MPHLFMNEATDISSGCGQRRWGRTTCLAQVRGRAELPYGDFDNDGDMDILDHEPEQRSLRISTATTAATGNHWLTVIAKLPNGDEIEPRRRGGDVFEVTAKPEITPDRSTWRCPGQGYLSQSELPVTLGLGRREQAERVVVLWPSGRVEEYKGLRSGRRYDIVEGKGITS